MSDLAIKVDNVSKSFILPHEKQGSVKGMFVNVFRRNKTFEKQHVLKNISIDIKKGEFFGIVGRNGSGKSTLLKLLGGIYSPDKGGITINGLLTPFIELGVGFNPELTGRENVYLNGALLGFSRKEMQEMYPEIVEFAELEKFMDQKLKNYSSGMQVRLAFSIAIRAHSDILLIDEVLAVGDADFQRKCFEIFKDIKRTDKTVVFVSHDMGAVKEYCERAVLVEKGEIISSGSAEHVANDYLQLFNKDAEASGKREDNRWGSFNATIENIDVVTGKDTIKVKYELHAHKDIKDPIFGFIIKDLDNHHLFDTNTKWKKINTGTILKGQKKIVSWDVPNVFKSGRYKLTVGAAADDGISFYDWQENIVKFDISRPEITAGMLIIDDQPTIK